MTKLTQEQINALRWMVLNRLTYIAQARPEDTETIKNLGDLVKALTTKGATDEEKTSKPRREQKTLPSNRERYTQEKRSA